MSLYAGENVEGDKNGADYNVESCGNGAKGSFP